MNTYSGPVLFSASSPIYSCCACTSYSPGGQMADDPKYATVMVCQRCGHTSCQGHFTNRVCYGCSFGD